MSEAGSGIQGERRAGRLAAGPFLRAARLPLPPVNEPLRIALRRLRWFRQAFRLCVERAGAELGCSFAVDEERLTRAFLDWLSAIEIQRPADKALRRAFFEFAAGLMLRELLASMPLAAEAAPVRADPQAPGAFWPEGYACTLFCLSLHAAAMEEEFGIIPEISPDFNDLRHWQSLRENTRQERSFAAGFLQLALGHQPNWLMPDVFRLRDAEAEPRGG